jgi:hypothetical protein
LPGLIAQVARLERVGDGETGRTSFEFDAIEHAAGVNLNLASGREARNTEFNWLVVNRNGSVAS